MAYHVIDGTIETERLLLKTPTQDDAEALFALFGDPDVMRSYGSGRTFGRTETLGALGKMLEHHDLYGYCVQMMLLKETGAVIGLAGLQRGPLTPGIQLGCVLAKDAWGKGYAFESSIALLDFGFNTLGLDSIEANTPTANAAAIALVHKLGMSYRGTSEHDGTEYAHFVTTQDTTKGRTTS